jgi:hypothetical protein
MKMTDPLQQEYTLSPEVMIRAIEIFQEALMMGIDGCDLFKDVRLVTSVDENGEQTVKLSDSYKAKVAEWHEYINKTGPELAASRDAILDTQGSSFIDDSGRNVVADQEMSNIIAQNGDRFLITSVK